MKSKSSKGQVEVNSTTIMIIFGLIVAIMVIIWFARADSGVLAKSTGMIGSFKECSKCIPQYGLLECLPLCWIL